MFQKPSRLVSSCPPCHTDIVSEQESSAEVDNVRQRLIEAEEEYQRARTDDYVTRLVRDSAIVDAHRAGLSSREISTLVGDIGQPNVVRARRRTVTRREVFPAGLLSPADAVRESGLGRANSFTPAGKVACLQSNSLAEFARSGLRTFAERATQADRQEPNGRPCHPVRVQSGSPLTRWQSSLKTSCASPMTSSSAATR